MSEMLLVLLLPFLGAVLLAWFGDRPWAADANTSISLLTLLAAVALATKSLAVGPMTELRRWRT